MSYKETSLEIWKMTRQEDARRIVILSAGAQAIVWAASILLLGASPLSQFVQALAIWLALLLISFLLAGILAVPGWMFRRQYDVRPMFSVTLISSYAYLFASEILMPLGFGLSIGFVFKALAFALLVGAQFIFWHVLLMTTLPHRWANGIFKTAFVLSALATVGLAKNYLLAPQDKFMVEVFEKRESNLVPLIGGRTVSSDQISYELRLFDGEVRGR